jgi:hypothetical protein
MHNRNRTRKTEGNKEGEENMYKRGRRNNDRGNEVRNTARKRQGKREMSRRNGRKIELGLLEREL